jgi:hypothetical protein
MAFLASRDAPAAGARSNNNNNNVLPILEEEEGQLPPPTTTAHLQNGDKGLPKQDAAIETTEDDAPLLLLQWFTGMQDDWNARWPLYADDWSRPQSISTVINATVYTFFIQLIPALIFAELMDDTTQGKLATAETLLSSAIIGIIYALFAGQPLTILGITGPVAILVGTSSKLAERFEAEYFCFFFWTCLWAGLLHMLTAMVGLVNLVWTVTPFTTQVFELFIAVTFLYASTSALLEPIVQATALEGGGGGDELAAALATLLLGILTIYIAWNLHFAEQWTLFTRQVRIVLSRYNTLIALIVVTALSYTRALTVNGSLKRVDITFPWDWQPTADRPWVTNPFQHIDATGIFAAMVPGLMFFLLFIIDHNVSSILTQSPNLNLKKPPAYHWDFFVLGITFLPCAILGLPPGNGLIPQAPLHARALSSREFFVDEHGVKQERVTHVEEQRWSGLAQATLVFVALAAFQVISWIPRGALQGVFFYLGMATLYGNEIWERFTLCWIIFKRRPRIPVVREVAWRTVQYWTAIQALCSFAIFAVAQFADFGYVYPALLVLLVPLRSYVLERLFDRRDLQFLDPFGDDQGESNYQKEQRMYHWDRVSEDSFDSKEFNFSTRAEFRGQGRPHRTRSLDDGIRDEDFPSVRSMYTARKKSREPSIDETVATHLDLHKANSI